MIMKQTMIKSFSVIENRLVHQQVSTIKNLDEAVDTILSGLILFLIEGEDIWFSG